MALRAPDCLARRASALWRDTDGLMAPYVAVMLPVLVGFALLALDGSRRMSLQTQMQAAADSLALAGARELDKQAGAESRAISAMANAHASTKSANTLFGVGSSPTLNYTFVFYSSLSAASDGIGGSVAIGDSDAKYVAVKITPQTWSTILPAAFLANISTNAFAVGADAVAGFAGTTVCSVAPIFVCNPYEDSGGSMTDAQATANGWFADGPIGPNQQSFAVTMTSVFNPEIRLTGVGNSLSAGLDDFNVDATGTTAVPEPATVTLVSCGLIGLARHVRRRRKP